MSLDKLNLVYIDLDENRIYYYISKILKIVGWFKVRLPSEQHSKSATQVPSILSPFKLHEADFRSFFQKCWLHDCVDFKFDNKQMLVSSVFKKQPKCDPQQRLAPKHVPFPAGPQGAHLKSITKWTVGLFTEIENFWRTSKYLMWRLLFCHL